VGKKRRKKEKEKGRLPAPRIDGIQLRKRTQISPLSRRTPSEKKKGGNGKKKDAKTKFPAAAVGEKGFFLLARPA